MEQQCRQHARGESQQEQSGQPQQQQGFPACLAPSSPEGLDVLTADPDEIPSLVKGEKQYAAPMPVACMDLHGEGFGVAINVIEVIYKLSKDLGMILMEAGMGQMDVISRITVHPDVMVGKPTIRGLRITVEQILKALANDVKIDQLLDDYPELEKEDIRAALLYASKLVDEERVFSVAAN
ncbi:MAG: DUF433 domain-containing protein [Smithella sp.]